MVEINTTALHEATLALLARTGVRVESGAALDLLAAHEIPVDIGSRRVYPSQEHVERALSTAPSSFKVYGRRTEAPLEIGGSSIGMLSGGASVRVLTLDGEYAPATWEHLRQFNTLLDALPNIHMLLNQVDPVHHSGNFYKRLAAEMLIGSPKPCCLQVSGVDDLNAAIRMSEAIRGGRSELVEKPVFMTGGNAEPPLCIPEYAAEVTMQAARAEVPCGIGDYVMMGVSAPCTVAGAAVQRNAVQLTALVLSQAAQPAAPFYYVAASGGANMRSLDPMTANPYAGKLLGVAATLGRAYSLPVVGLAPSDAKSPDAQAACERTALIQLAMECGVNLIQGPTSMMDQMMLSSFAQAVIDNDIIGYLLALRSPFAVSTEDVGLGVIHEVVTDPSFGDLRFAMHPHTSAHFRRDLWEPMVFSCDSFAAWRRDGSRSLLDRAADVVRRLLRDHKPEPLEATVEREIRRISEG